MAIGRITSPNHDVTALPATHIPHMQPHMKRRSVANIANPATLARNLAGEQIEPRYCQRTRSSPVIRPDQQNYITLYGPNGVSKPSGFPMECLMVRIALGGPYLHILPLNLTIIRRRHPRNTFVQARTFAITLCMLSTRRWGYGVSMPPRKHIRALTP